MHESPNPYHHGDLPNALKAAAVEVIIEKGASGFSLREVARRAGVSHAAPAHHYGDSAGLLTAIAIDGFEHLRNEVLAAKEQLHDPIDRLAAAGRAYVQTGVSYPAHAAIIFRGDLVNADDPRYVEAGDLAYATLEDCLIDIRDRCNPGLDVELWGLQCWATMQGLLVLYPTLTRRAEQHGTVVPELADLAEHIARRTVNGMLG